MRSLPEGCGDAEQGSFAGPHPTLGYTKTVGQWNSGTVEHRRDSPEKGEHAGPVTTIDVFLRRLLLNLWAAGYNLTNGLGHFRNSVSEN